MSITVRYFASVRERLGREEQQLESSGIHSVSDVWVRATEGQTLLPNMLASINQEIARFEDAVADGDEVAFFPPVMGG